MTFNWFRRQYDESASNQGEQAATPGEQPSTENTESPTTEAAQESTELLDYAKAAYETIRRRQQAEAAAQAASETPATEPVSELVVEPGEAIDTPPEPSSDHEPDLTPTAPPAAAESAPETIVEAATDAGQTADSSETADATQPFWARAEAERLERLERLKETAIEEPEPEPIAAETTPVAEPIPELVFDEGFLWSTEVLAAQGRRASEISVEEITWLKRLRQGLDKTRRSLINQLKAIVGQGPLNQDAVMEIEALLLQADVGVTATDRIIAALQSKLREETLPPEQAISYLKQILRDMLDQPLGGIVNNRIPVLAPEANQLNIWLITGVNGAGKTTTIGKLAHIAQKSGYRCLIAAADTFRAAAVEQVKVWGQRSGVEVIANPGQNTDPAAVVFDAITAAQSRGSELLLVDTAGRLQNKKNLMDELNKVRRIIDRKAADAKIESLLVLDATLGQNGLRQAEVFRDAAQLSGVVLTKLDGTAKGGIALAIVQELGLPIRFIGAGEGIEDLRPFSSYEFVEALLSN